MLTFLMSAPVVSLAPSSRPGAVPRMVAGAARSVAAWNERRRQLRALSELDDDLLQDIGLSRDDIEHACSRPFWGLKSLLRQPPAAP